jgi:hypothetical protein
MTMVWPTEGPAVGLVPEKNPVAVEPEPLVSRVSVFPVATFWMVMTGEGTVPE